MHARRLVALAAAALLLAAPAATSAPAPSGLRGTVMRSPSTPVCRSDRPCSAPAYVWLVFTRAGATPVRVHTTKAGAYRILLRPGIYAIRTTLVGIGHTPEPKAAHVRIGHVDRLDLTIDTGIR
jgi:hypothetical protein